MSFFVWILVALAAFFIQTQLSFIHRPLNLTVLVVYMFSMKRLVIRGVNDIRTERESTLYGAVVGLIEDALAGSIIGPGILSKGLIGFATSVTFSDVIFRWTPLFGGIVIVLFTLLDGFLVVTWRNVFSEIDIANSRAFEMVLMQALINLPFGIIVKPKSMH